MLTAPAEAFATALPQMTEIWQSWSISQGEMSRRTAQAMLNMQETILEGGQPLRRAVQKGGQRAGASSPPC